MWRRAFLGLSFLGLLSFANGCAVTSTCGGGCGEGCGEFAGGQPILPPITGHISGCGCGGAGVGTPGCAAPANIACGCGGACACPTGGGGGLAGRGPLARLFGAAQGAAHGGGQVFAAPLAPGCPTCAAPVYSGITYAPPVTAIAPPALAPALAPPIAAPVLTPAPAIVAPQSVFSPPVVDSIPLGVPVPAPVAAPAPSTPAPAPAGSEPSGTEPDAVPTPGDTDDPGFESEFGAGGASYYQPRAVRPVNAIPMRNGGYYIQPTSAQQRQIPMRRVQQSSAQGLPVFHLD